MNGILCVDKPQGLTSFDVVARVRRAVNERRVGHAGTLDPMATGVLPVFIGSATRFISHLPCQDKAYTAGFRLGVTTDTGDSTGHVLSTSPVQVSPGQVYEAVSSFQGEIMQVPPMYSALKSNGRRLYELAREGVEVERKPRPVTIYEIAPEGREREDGIYSITVRCSKGTYIRTLVEDIGMRLGCGAVMTSLRRTFAAGFSLTQTVTLEEMFALKENGALAGRILPVESPFLGLPCVRVSEKQAVRFSNGGELALDRLQNPPPEGVCRVKRDDLFLGLGAVDGERQSLRIECLFTG